MGEICKKLFPIPEDFFFGNQESSLALCTLSSITLLKQVAKSDLMNKISVVGRLLSENKGIDSLVKNTISNDKIKTILLCGREVYGHKAGQSLLALYENGIDSDNRIISSLAPNPKLTITELEIDKFQNQVQILDEIGETDINQVSQLVCSIKI